MAGIFSWSSTAGSNTTVDGINIDEGCPPGNVNNAIRSVMALVKSTFSSGLETFFAGSAALPVANGGTGATTAADARSNLSAAKTGSNSDITALTGLTTAITIAQGGTGQTTGPAALQALGLAYTTNSNGWCVTLPIGSTTILVQWGTRTSGADAWSSSYDFPVAFSSTTGIAIFGNKTRIGAGSVDGNAISARAVSATQFQIGSDDVSETCTWLAIGLG